MIYSWIVIIVYWLTHTALHNLCILTTGYYYVKGFRFASLHSLQGTK